MKHSTTLTPSSNEQGSSSATENCAVRCAVTTPKTHTVGLTSDQAFTSPLSRQQNDILTGQRIEDDAASNCPADHTDDDDAGCCWKTVIKKRRARKMNTQKETQPSESISGVSQRNVHKQSENQHLPRLLIHDKKIILRPHGGLSVDRWTRLELAGALWSAAGLTTKDREDIIFRLRPLQNLAIINTPQCHEAGALYRVRELTLGERVYPITTYFVAPKNSCKSIVPGIVPGMSSSTLVDELVAPATQILQVRMMGQTNIALVPFEGLKVPHYVRIYGAELQCSPIALTSDSQDLP
ncbi:hypothetical protein HPB51_005134 [Rhipicephalus microplus]|uniref:Uncharacterized protein n=1 Tax=Rhipicephalus microplus TaxID=6941 RepID=A0A9J6EM21_RHIMP|nr:hypothetical protein HPB51_005134 [Rhipicephalus microplus]